MVEVDGVCGKVDSYKFEWVDVGSYSACIEWGLMVVFDVNGCGVYGGGGGCSLSFASQVVCESEASGIANGDMMAAVVGI